MQSAFISSSQVSKGQITPLKQRQSDVLGIPRDIRHSYEQTTNPGSAEADAHPLSESGDTEPTSNPVDGHSTTTLSLSDATETGDSSHTEFLVSVEEERDGGSSASSSGSPWFQLRKDAAAFVSQTLQRGRRNLWQLMTSRVSVLLSSAAVCSMSIHQFLKNHEDLNVFILAGEAFCDAQAVEFRHKVKSVCENYFKAFHRQNIYALKMVLEKENWLTIPPDSVQVVSFAGLVGDGAALIVSSDRSSVASMLHPGGIGSKKSGFSIWLKSGNPFSLKLSGISKEYHDSFMLNGSTSPREPNGISNENFRKKMSSPGKGDANYVNGSTPVSEDENEDLHADFIDEDSQLPSRISKPNHVRNYSSHWNDDEMKTQTGSSLCLLRLMDKYARLMQKLEIVNLEFFKGICQLFGVFFHFVFETFCQHNTKGLNDSLSYQVKTALSRIAQDCEQWIKSSTLSLSSSSTTTMNMSLTDVTPTSPPCSSPSTGFSLKERCAAADTLSLVARLLHRSKTHLQSMLLQSGTAVVEDFYVNLVDSVPDLIENIHKTTAKLLLHIDGYVDRIANAKWEVKELGIEHNGYVDLLLGEFKHYKTQLAHGGIQKEVQDILLEYGLDSVAETLIEGLSRVKRCTDEGRALMSLDLQVLINGLQHFVYVNVRPKLQMVETFIKAYYLPETEYMHWARAHPEYTKNQIIGLINLVATMKGWKRKSRLEVLEKIELA